MNYCLETSSRSGYGTRIYPNYPEALQAYNTAWCFEGEVRLLEGNFEETRSGFILEHGRSSVVMSQQFDHEGNLIPPF